MSRPVRAFVALGANIGDPIACLRSAVIELSALPETTLVARSSLYRSAPVGLTGQPDFFNGVVSLDTTLPARELLRRLLSIEAWHGRVRSIPNAPRTLDLDLLLHGDSLLAEPELTLPHPRMHQRAFVLLPLLEIAPDVVLPGLGHAQDFLPGVADQDIALFGPLFDPHFGPL